MTWTYVMDETALPEGGMAPVYPLGDKRRHRARRWNSLCRLGRMRSHGLSTVRRHS